MKRTSKSVKLSGILTLVIALTALISIFSPMCHAYDTAPQIKSIYCVDGGVMLKWNSVAAPQNYRLMKFNSLTNEWDVIKSTLSASSYTDKKVKSGERYYYAIVDGSNNCNTSKTIIYVDAPSVTQVKRISDGIKIKWTKVTGAENYCIYRKTDSSEYKKIAVINSSAKSSYTDKTVKNGVRYAYTVRSVNKDGCRSAVPASKSATFLKTPTSFSVANSPKGVTLKWKKNTAPQKYEIARKIGKADWVTIATVSSDKSSYIDKKAKYGSQNAYRIRAVSNSDASYYTKRATVRALDPKKPAIALTFDDGPYSPVTNLILDTLEKYNSKATFFVVGSRVETYKDCVKREAALGCEIGCHTYNHAILTRLSANDIKKEINSGVKIIEKYSSGQKVRIVRTPGGAVNDTVKKNVKYPLINWSVDTLDWQHRTTSKTVGTIKSYARDGSIVLMHDLYTSTGNAAVEIIPWLVNKGYQLVTVSELFELKGINAAAGSVYTHG